MIDIRNIQGSVIYSTEINVGSKRKFTLMKEDYITLRFSLEKPINFPLGTKVDDASIGLFEVVDLQKPTRNNSTGGYDYELRLDSYYWKWKNKIFKFTPETGGQEASWSLTASLDVHLSIFLKNLKALGYQYRGIEFDFSIDATVENKAVSMSYQNINMIDALTALAEAYECEWWVTDNIIHFGRCEYGTPVDFEIDNNVVEMTRSESQSNFATRLYVFGSTRNIPANYRHVSESVVVNGVVQKRLMLPEGLSYLDAYEDMPQEEAIEEVVILEDVYPRMENSISTVDTYSDTVENEDGTTNTETFYRFKDNSFTFSKDYILEGQELRVKFQSGSLNGMDFGVEFNPNAVSEKLENGSWNPEAQLFEIVVNEDYGRKLPDGTLNPKVGDKYILYGWDSTKLADLGLVSKAEVELERKGREILAKRKIDPNTYNCKMFSDYMYGLNSDSNQDSAYSKHFEVGDKVNLINSAYFENGRQSRIIGYEYNLDFPFDNPVYTVGETAAYSRLGEIESKLDSLTLAGQTYVGGGGSGVYIIGTNDNTAPTNKNVYSALKSDKSFLRKDNDDRTEHSLEIGKDFTVNGKTTLEGDTTTKGKLTAENESTFKNNVVVEGESTLKGEFVSESLSTFKDDVVVEKDLDVKSNLSIGNTLTIAGKDIKEFTRFYDEKKPLSSDVSFYSSLMTDQRIEEEFGKIDDKYIRKDKEDTAKEHITFEKGITVNDLAKLLNLEVDELATIARAIVQVIGSSKFVDGFAGEGFQIWQDIASGDWTMTLDRLTVRKVMTIYELIIQKIRSVGGTIVVSSGNGRVKEVEKVGTEYRLSFEDVNTFDTGDLIRCKVYSTVGMKDYWVEVTRVVGEWVYTRVSEYEDAIPEVGDEVVLMGNTRNTLRQNMILISATEDGQPRFDCMDGIKSKSFENCLKVRVGCLDGISDDRFPSDLQPNGYGIYGNNCFLTGVFVLSNGTDVRTQFSILEGMIRSEISSVRSEINAKDNYLSNSSFSENLLMWSYENDVRVFNTSGGLLHFNGDLYSDKRIFAGVVENGGKNVLRIKKSFIKQYNRDFSMQPAFSMYEEEIETEEGTVIVERYKPRMFYISFKYMCTSPGTLNIYFDGETEDGSFELYQPITYSEYVSSSSSFSLKEISGKWNGTGNFYLSFDGDIFIYDLALADNALADLEEKFTMRFEMTDQKIQANGEAIKKSDSKIEKYYSEWKLTAEGMSSSFNKQLSDQYSKITEEYSGKIEQTAESLTVDYEKKIKDSYDNTKAEYSTLIGTTAEGITVTMAEYIDNIKSDLESADQGLIEDYEAKIAASAKELTSDYQAAIKNLKDGTIANMQSQINQNAESITTKVSKTDFNALGQRVSTAETKINQTAEKVELRALKSDMDALSGEMETKYSELSVEADSIKTSVGNLDSSLEAAIKRIQGAEDALDAVEDKTDELDKYLDDAFKDGIIDEAEAIAIKKYLNSLANTMAGLQSSYNNVINHEALSGKTERTVLVEKYGTLVSKYNSLVSAISTAIADGKATDEESKSVDNAFADFNAAIDAFNSALENARYKIAGFYAEKAVDTAEKALYDALPDDYKTKEGTYASALVQMAEGISTIAGRFDSSGKLIEGAGWVTTAQGNQLWATNNTVNALDNTVKNNTSLINQQADKITSLVTETDALGTRQTTLEQTADGLSLRVTNVETGNTTNSNKISAIDVRLSAIESFVGEGGDIEGSFDSFKNALDELAADITSNTEKAAAAQKTADEAKGLSESNLTKINQNAQQITVLAGKVTTDASGNITNISTSGLVLDSEFASLFSTEVSSQGIAKTAQLDAYVLETELGDLVSKIQISADQINLSGVITSDMLSPTLKSSLASSSEVNALQDSLNQSVANLNTTISGLQTEVSQKASLKNLNDKVSELNTALSGKADTSLKNAVIEGNTLIVGGYINTDLIQASELRIKNSQVSGLGALATKDAVTTTDLGLKDWVKKSSVTAAMEGETIIVGGYINTDLIKADAIIAKQLSTATDANGFNVEASSGSIDLMKNGSSVIGITADGITPTLRVGPGGSEYLLMTPDALRCYSGTNKTIQITGGSLNLDYAATIKGFAIGNFHSSTFGGTTDFAVASGTRTLPSSSSYPGKVIFIKCNGSVTFNTTGSDKIVRWSSNAQVSSISTDGSSLFFISNGSGLWYGFVCH